MSKLNSTKITATFLFIFILAIYLSNAFADFSKDLSRHDYRNLATSADIVPNTFLPLAIYHNQSFAFDGISRYLKGFDASVYYFIKTGDSYYSSYPIFTGIVATPFYIIPLMLNKIPDLMYPENILKTFLLGRVTASILTAVSAVFIYLILSRLSRRKWLVILFTIFYALGTNSWSISSRGLWQHTTSQLFISILVYILLKSEENPKLYFWAGFVSGLAFLSRPTNIIICAIIGLYILIYKREYILKYVIGMIPSFLFMGWYNFAIFGSPLSQGYSARGDLKWTTSLLESIPGFLVSPARSFLFISPPLVFAYLMPREKLLRFLWLSFIASLLLFSKWYAWEGSNGFGYRMLTDFVPLATVLSFILIDRLKKPALIVVCALMLYSVVVQYNAVFNLKSRCERANNWNMKCLPR